MAEGVGVKWEMGDGGQKGKEVHTKDKLYKDHTCAVFFSLCICLFVSVLPSLCVFLSLYLFSVFFLSLPFSLYLCFSFLLFFSQRLSVSVCVCLCICLSLCLISL